MKIFFGKILKNFSGIFGFIINDTERPWAKLGRNFTWYQYIKYPPTQRNLLWKFNFFVTSPCKGWLFALRASFRAASWELQRTRWLIKNTANIIWHNQRHTLTFAFGGGGRFFDGITTKTVPITLSKLVNDTCMRP